MLPNTSLVRLTDIIIISFSLVDKSDFCKLYLPRSHLPGPQAANPLPYPSGTSLLFSISQKKTDQHMWIIGILTGTMMQPIFPNHGLTLIILTSSLAAAPVLASVCYYSANGSIFQSPNYVTPCGNPSATSGTINCCDLSANNICLSNSLCYDPNVSGGAYYLSPCTDRTYTAPECPQYCGKLAPNFRNPSMKCEIRTRWQS